MREESRRDLLGDGESGGNQSSSLHSHVHQTEEPLKQFPTGVLQTCKYLERWKVAVGSGEVMEIFIVYVYKEMVAVTQLDKIKLSAD